MQAWVAGFPSTMPINLALQIELEEKLWIVRLLLKTGIERRAQPPPPSKAPPSTMNQMCFNGAPNQ